MPAIARVGDSVLPGCGHVSTIVSGSGTTFADGIPVARIGDSVAGPYVATITSGSGTTNADGIPVARIGDSTFGTCPLDHSGAKGIQPFVGSGVIISGSGTSFAD
jgi:uncharacterized Zn-binding protein involved in type VI secretion